MRRHTGALFAWEDLSDVPAKGLPAPVLAWRAKRSTACRFHSPTIVS